MTNTAAIDDAEIGDEAEIALPARRSNMPITFMHRVEYILALFLFGLFRLIGIDAASALAGGFTRTLGPMLRPISKRAEDNLAKIYPDWPPEKIRATTKEIFENLGRTAAEFAHLDKFRPFEEGGRVDVEGEDKLRAIADGGGPVIFVSGHFANWELMPITIHRSGVRYSFVYRAANNPLVDELIIKKRAQVMSRWQIPKGKRGGRGLIETMKAGRSIAMLVDQKLNDGISVPFMGHEAMTAPAAARLSLKFNAPVIPISLERVRGAHFRLIIHDPLAFSPSSDTRADISKLTAQINATLEEYIRARPGQWLWLHRRWPKGN